jgi:hypothetical protein
VVRTARLLGRTFDYCYVVTRPDLDRMVELKVERPFPMLVRYELIDTDDGTSVAIHAVGTPGRFFGPITTVMARQVRKSTAADLTRLQTCLAV